MLCRLCQVISVAAAAAFQYMYAVAILTYSRFVEYITDAVG